MPINHVAFAIAKLCPEKTVAELLVCLLSCDQDERLTDDEADAGESLFDALCDIVPPHVVKMAQSM